MGASVLLHDSEGRLLIVNPNYREQWSLPGGVVDEAESPRDAVMREVREELGLTIAPERLKLRLINYHCADDGFQDSVYMIFDGGRLTEEEISGITLAEDELDEYRFASMEEVEQLLAGWRAHLVKLCEDDPDKVWYTENGVPA